MIKACLTMKSKYFNIFQVDTYGRDYAEYHISLLSHYRHFEEIYQLNTNKNLWDEILKFLDSINIYDLNIDIDDMSSRKTYAYVHILKDETQYDLSSKEIDLNYLVQAGIDFPALCSTHKTILTKLLMALDSKFLEWYQYRVPSLKYLIQQKCKNSIFLGQALIYYQHSLSANLLTSSHNQNYTKEDIVKSQLDSCKTCLSHFEFIARLLL